MWQAEPGGDASCPYYSVYRLIDIDNGMNALRSCFPDGKANALNFVLFSTSGVHGSYRTIEEAESELGELAVTFLIVMPRVVILRYGVCVPQNADDIAFLKLLRDTSHQVVAKIGRCE